MLQNSSRAMEKRVLSLVRSAPGRNEGPSDKVVKLRNRWPFTVVPSFQAAPTQEMRHHDDNGSFVT